MREFRLLLLAVVTAGLLGFGGLAAIARADSGIDLSARLHHSATSSNATGYSEYDRDATGREVEVTVRHIRGLSGHRVIVYVNYQRVGTMFVNRYGVAHREWDTDRGQFVPFAASGDPIRVRTAGGRLVASGWYHLELDD
jgi:hypothetical protein